MILFSLKAAQALLFLRRRMRNQIPNRQRKVCYVAYIFRVKNLRTKAYIVSYI